MRRLEIVRLIAKTKRADLRRESVNDVCDRCTPAELTRDEKGGLEGVREPHAAGECVPFPTLWSHRSEPEGSIKGSIGTAYWRSCKFSPNEKRQFAALLQSPLTDSNRRPPPYHEREEGADPCGFAHSGAGSHVSLVAARHRVFHGRATLVRPGLTARLVRLVHRQARLLPRQLSTSIPFHLAAKARVGRPVSVSGGIPIGECEDLTAREMKSSQEESALRCHHRRRLPA
jgi:hypothetical protein